MFENVRYDIAHNEDNHAVTTTQNNGVYSDDQQLFVGNLLRSVPEWEIKKCFESMYDEQEMLYTNIRAFDHILYHLCCMFKRVRIKRDLLINIANL